jgi:hypothetical protein
VEETCPYIKSKAGRRPLSKSYAALGRSCLKNHILPVFGSMRIDRITDGDLDGWLPAFQDEGYSANTANSAFGILQVMTGWLTGNGSRSPIHAIWLTLWRRG